MPQAMAENENGQEKTEQPSEKRLREAREKGNVPRSRELSTVAVFGAGVAALLAFGGSLAARALDWMRQALTPDLALVESPHLLFGHAGKLLLGFMWILVPLLLVTLLACFLSPLVMGGMNFATKGLVPDPKRINPLSGLKRIYGPEGLAELLKSLLRVSLVGTAAALFLLPGMHRLRAMTNQPLEVAAGNGLKFALWMMMATAAALLLLGLLDAPYQKWNWRRKLKMTRQELREELKETEGKPEVKGRIRQLQQQMARQRMMEDVPGADAIIVTKCPAQWNPRMRQKMIDKIQPQPGQQLFFSRFDYGHPYSFFNPQHRIELGSGRDWVMVSAIANTDYLMQYLEGFENKYHLMAFTDHHQFTANDISQMVQLFTQLNNREKFVLTTEKDAVRLEPHRQYLYEKRIPVFVLPVQVSFLDEDQDRFDRYIRDFLLNFKV